MTEPLRRGVVEVETLRRYGHVPVGTRAVLPVSLYKCDATRYVAHFPLRIGKDPLKCDVSCLITWGGGEEETIRMEWNFRGVLKSFEGTLAEFALLRVVEGLEYDTTRSGHQRFRVIRAEWNEG
jgi:hypothetical protein